MILIYLDALGKLCTRLVQYAVKPDGEFWDEDLPHANEFPSPPITIDSGNIRNEPLSREEFHSFLISLIHQGFVLV